MTETEPTIDAATSAWTRNRSDELAAEAGCRFDPERGAYTVFWVERYCKLYEGVQGAPLTLRGCHRCGEYDLPPAVDFADWEEGKAAALERAEKYAACVAAGHPVDWQYECVMRLFGWVRWSEKWQRDVRRFRQASIWVPKKNKKSPTLSALGMYLLCGDGEPGQKVFLAAKDGRQAREIAGKHAVEMLLQSPELEAECKLNKSTLQITHEPSRSVMLPLSSSNSRTQESKEGLNGSVLIDETHVVDRDFVRRLDRAGISRSEPMHVEVSTAGNNPDGYGKERFDYARRVERGDAVDQALFVAIYAAPQDLTPAQLDADPEKFGRLANPAWGHTVDPEEYLADYQKSKRSIQALLDFMMYRLDVWQRAANPWLKAGDWHRCRRNYTEADLLGRRCWAALDLSRSRDMTALVLVFPWPEKNAPEAVRLLPYFWLPAERVQEIESQIPDVHAWVQGGDLELTPGGVIDYGYVRARFLALHAKFKIQELVYDPRYAEETTQALSEGAKDDTGKVVEQGTGVPRLVFTQDDASFAAPTEDFERLVIAGQCNHNGHPVLTWQVGHACCIVKANKVKRVVKPTRNPTDARTIDGVVGAIMGLARAQRGPESTWYTPGILRN